MICGAIRDRLDSLIQAMKEKDLSEKQVFILVNRLDRLIEYLNQ